MLIYVAGAVAVVFVLLFYRWMWSATQCDIAHLCWCNVDSRFLHNKRLAPEWALTFPISLSFTGLLQNVSEHFNTYTHTRRESLTQSQSLIYSLRLFAHWQWDYIQSHISLSLGLAWIIRWFKAPTVSVYNQSSKSTVQNKSFGIAN